MIVVLIRSEGTSYDIVLDKSWYQLNSFLISRRKHILRYSLEAPHRGASNEYPQHKFLSRNKTDTDTFWLKLCMYIFMDNCGKYLSGYYRPPKLNCHFDCQAIMFFSLHAG